MSVLAKLMPAELPFEQPTTFEPATNRKTAIFAEGCHKTLKA
jgi:hypothetical protein